MSGNTNSLANLIGRWSKLYECEIDVIATVDNIYIGAKVWKGPTWGWWVEADEQVFGKEQEGEGAGVGIVRSMPRKINGQMYVNVEWESGVSNAYSISPEQDLVLII